MCYALCQQGIIDLKTIVPCGQLIKYESCLLWLMLEWTTTLKKLAVDKELYVLPRTETRQRLCRMFVTLKLKME